MSASLESRLREAQRYVEWDLLTEAADEIAAAYEVLGRIEFLSTSDRASTLARDFLRDRVERSSHE